MCIRSCYGDTTGPACFFGNNKVSAAHVVCGRLARHSSILAWALFSDKWKEGNYLHFAHLIILWILFNSSSRENHISRRRSCLVVGYIRVFKQLIINSRYEDGTCYQILRIWTTSFWIYPSLGNVVVRSMDVAECTHYKKWISFEDLPCF